MNTVTLNTFPSINAFTSPRAWFLAIIMLLHAGFVWMLSSEPGFEKIVDLPPPLITTFTPAPPKPTPQRQPIDVSVNLRSVYVPAEVPPTARYESESAQEIITPVPPQTGPGTPAVEPPAPAITEPQIDARIGLSEPAYPSADVRAGNIGTVVLSVLVLENGRIGEVRLDQSSGHARLDESAMREARHWRLKPGMRDGVPVATWKQIPVTFRLRDSVKM